jgi:hypothetical protein
LISLPFISLCIQPQAVRCIRGPPYL